MRWVLPVCVYALAVWGGCELAQRSDWALVWLAFAATAACCDGRQAYRDTGSCQTMWLADGRIELGANRVDARVGVIERAWLGPFACAVWLHAGSARRLLVVYRAEMSSADYAALRRHLKLWAPRAPLRR